MAGQKFQYDESGSTFFYFILSFLALILIPATFYFWPRKKVEGKARHEEITVKAIPLRAHVFLIL
jgi:translocation protein SEC63